MCLAQKLSLLEAYFVCQSNMLTAIWIADQFVIYIQLGRSKNAPSLIINNANIWKKKYFGDLKRIL